MQEGYCSWGGPVPVTLVDGVCQVGDPDPACWPHTGATTAAGCGVSPDGCAEVYFRRERDLVLVDQECGGSPVVGFEPCTYIEPFVYDPPECGCVCPGGEGTSSGGPGPTTGSSGSGGE